MDEYHVDMQGWRRWPKALIMRRVWSTNGHNRHREVRRYVPDGYAKEVEHENANLRHMMEYYTDWAHDEVLKARGRENRERASTDRLRDRIHEIAADRDRLKELLEESEHDESMAWDRARKAEAENAKLRELVRIAVEYCANGYCAEEDECPLYESRTSCKLYAKARELGIEV